MFMSAGSDTYLEVAMLPRAEVQAGFPPELVSFSELVRSLDEPSLTRPSRCAGWTVGDVAAHMAGTMADVVAGRLEGAGSPEWTSRQVEERKGRSGTELADEIAGAAKVAADLLAGFDDAVWAGPAPAGVTGTLGDGVLGLWYDAYLHADDIRDALGQEPVGGPGLRAGVHHAADLLTTREWGPAVLTLDGLEQIAISGGGSQARRISGDAVTFLLVATGRKDAATLDLDPSVNVYAV
jgi:uncharacterized protein (TIGR03083 family)